ncbi:hypothetical protein [Pseudomonas sp. NA-150]|uniref:hypothetical protein n=1 Tax=Pseudomonas sp. NA-150 TaxID=3367525 RepID=UPI0037CCBAF3
MATNQINARLLDHYDTDTMLVVGGLMSGVAGIVIAATTWSDWGGLPLLISGCFLFVSATGFVLANAITGALNCLPQFSGSASALAGAMQYGSGILGSALIAILANGTPWPMGLVVAICGVGCALGAISALRTTHTFDHL